MSTRPRMSILGDRRPDAVGRRALALFDAAPVPDRAHVMIRWVSCPVRAVAGAVPAAGRVLEVGCGHGLVAAYLALQSRERTVVGVDIDPSKIAVAEVAARRARAGGASMIASVTPSGDVPTGPWDAVVIVDVLYLLDPPAQRALLSRCRAVLAPGGVLVVKEMGTRPRWKYRWNATQEHLSVRLLRITDSASGGFAFTPPETTGRWLRDLGLDVASRRVDDGRVHPHHLIVGTDRRPPDRGRDA